MDFFSLSAGRTRGATACLCLAAAALLAGAFAATATPASAAFPTYTVFPCSGHSPPEQIKFEEVGDRTAFHADDNCGNGGGSAVIHGDNHAINSSFRDHSGWFLAAPAFAEIREIELDQSFSEAWPGSSLAWTVYANGNTLESAGNRETGDSPPVGGSPLTWVVGPVNGPGEFEKETRAFSMQVECADVENGCKKSTDVDATSSAIKAVLTDPRPPRIEAIGGTLTGAGEKSGSGTITFTGLDEETGVFSTELQIDQQAPVSRPGPSNGGLCQEPYVSLIPCTRLAPVSYTIDTTTLTDQNHKLTLRACDATHTCGSFQIEITVHNAPTNTAPPAISGTAKVGAQLSADLGTWEEKQGAPTTFAFQWFRCGANQTTPAQCEPIPGATDSHYTPVKADAGKRVLAQVTGRVPMASTSAASALSELVAESGPTGPGPTGPGEPGPVQTPPQTVIKKHPPKKSSKALASFTFVSTTPSSSFECKLDKAAFKTCHSPFKKKLKPGGHSFQVRARNAAGIVDPTPAVARWRVLRTSR